MVVRQWQVILITVALVTAAAAAPIEMMGHSFHHVSCSSYSFSLMGEDVDGQAEKDQFGFSVSLSADGERLAASSPYHDGRRVDSGHVQVYQWKENGVWEQLGEDIEGASTESFAGRFVSISADGSRVAVDTANSVQVYGLDENDAWVQVGSDIEGKCTDLALSADGRRFVAAFTANATFEVAHVRVFELNDRERWQQLGSQISPGDPNSYTVAISEDGDRVVVGDPLSNESASLAGAVRAYELNDDTEWELLGQEIHGENEQETFGVVVAMTPDGNRLAAPTMPLGSTSSVRVYDLRENGSWEQVGQAIFGGLLEGQVSWRISVALSADRVAIGDPYIDKAGHVRLFELDVSGNGDSTWVQLSSTIVGEARGDQSGHQVSISGDGSRIGIGAAYNDGNGSTAGHVRVYELECDNHPEPTPTDAPPMATDAPPTPTEPPNVEPEDPGPNACFPGEATVQLEDGSEKRMSDIVVGDRVLVAGGKFNDVFGFGHRMETIVSTYLQIQTEKGAQLEVSSSHYLPVGDKLTVARNLRVGDVLTRGDGTGDKIVHVSPVKSRGLYNPHTGEGSIVVSDILASTYTESVHPRVAHLLLAIPRALYRIGLEDPLGSMLYDIPPRLLRALVPRGRPVLSRNTFLSSLRP